MEQSHEEIKSLIAPYVLGAVPADEVPLIRSHILSCEDCMAEADRYSNVAESLAHAVPAIDVPDGFADTVLSRIAEERPVTSAPAARRRSFQLLVAVSSAAVVTVVGILGAVLVDTRNELAANRRLALALVRAAPGIDLEGSGGASGKLVRRDGGLVFVAVGLEDAPQGRTYQLWLIDDDQPLSAGTFDATSGVVLFETGHSVSRFDDAAVTIEPDGGSSKPTTAPVIASL